MTVRISMFEAYLIETIRSKGMDSQQLLDLVKQSDYEQLNQFDDTFDYQILTDAYKDHPEIIEKAITEEYKVKFVTQPGIKRFLGLKFDFEEGKDFQIIDDKFTNIHFTAEQLSQFTTLLSANWKISKKEETEDGKQIVDIRLSVHQ